MAAAHHRINLSLPMRARRRRRTSTMNVTRRHFMWTATAAAIGLRPLHAEAASLIGVRAGIFATPDLAVVLPEILQAYAASGGATLVADYRSSADINQRMGSDNPPDLLIGIDEGPALQLAEKGLVADSGIPLAEGRLSLVVNRRSPLADDVSLGSIAEAARNDVPFRVALGNPDNTAYGGCATDVLERWSVDLLLRPRFVYSDDLNEAVRLVASGHIAVGLIPKSLAGAPAVARAIHAVDIPGGWHRPLVQRAVLARNAAPEAQRFFAFLKTEPARRQLTRAGYEIPGR